MKKEVCQQCYTRSRDASGKQLVHWGKWNDEKWSRGELSCLHQLFVTRMGQVNDPRDSVLYHRHHPPEWCRMKLEHLVLDQEDGP